MDAVPMTHDEAHSRPGFLTGRIGRDSMIRIACLLALLLFAGAASAASSGTGVAFVHGTGKQTNAYNDYWQPTMVNTVRQGLVNQSNYVVINCDFEQYMWDSRAAGCLASQLTSFINSKNITLSRSSAGGWTCATSAATKYAPKGCSGV